MKKCTELSEMYESHITQKLCSAEIAKWALIGSLIINKHAEKHWLKTKGQQKVEKTEKTIQKVAHSFAALKWQKS